MGDEFRTDDPQVDDATLIRAARGGDRRAFGVVFMRHERLVRALCRRTLRDAWWADDAVQETAVRALLTLDRLRNPQQVGPWLAGIGLNVCREWLRSRSYDWWSWEAISGGIIAAEPVDEQTDTAACIEDRLLAERVRQAVADLPHGLRAATMLFYLRGMTHTEAAAALGIGTSAIKLRLHRARARLRVILQDEWEEYAMNTPGVPQTENTYIAVRVADVRRRMTDEGRHQYMVILEETDGTRRLPIWIGNYEGEAIARALEKVSEHRPMTYRLMLRLLQASGATMQEVKITLLPEGLYIAEIVLDRGGTTTSVDARSSDALNLALLAGVPISVEADTLTQAAMTSDKPSENPYAEGTEGAAQMIATSIDTNIVRAVDPTTTTTPQAPE